MSQLEVGIQPVVNWPRRAREGGRYVVVADVILAEPGDWPYQREEFVIGCVLEGGSAFSVEALGSTSLVLHRFGGTYGPVRFLVRAERDPASSGVDELRLTFLTEGGVPFRRIPLAVRPADGADDEWPTTPVEVVARPRPPDPAPRPSAVESPANGSLTVLHLSDLWFFDVRAEPGAADLYARLLDDLAELSTGRDPRPDLVVVAGDLAQSGRAQEFARAFEFLAGVSAATGVPRSHFAIVPGNHDVNRRSSEAYFLTMEADDLEPTHPYYPKWKAFANAFHEFYGDVHFAPDEPWTVFPMPDLGVVVAGLNSTIAESHLPTDHYGLVGEEQLEWFARRLEGFRQLGWLRLAAVHHDPSAPESDARRLRDAADLDRVLGRTGLVNAVLHGSSTAGGSVWRLPSGLPAVPTIDTPAPAAGGQRRCQLVTFTAGGLVRDGRRYEPEAGRWTVDARDRRTGDWRDRVEIRFADVDEAFSPGDQPPRPQVTMRAAADDLLTRVEEVTRLRFPDAAVTSRPEAGYLRVVSLLTDRSAVRMWPVGVVEGPITPAVLETFVTRVHAPFAAADPSVTSEIVYAGPPAPPALFDAAARRGVRLRTFVEYQGLLDLRPVLERQRLLEGPTRYLPQRFRRLGQGGDTDVHTGALEEVTRWLSVPEPQLVMVLGSSGTGKTTLLRRLTDTLPEALPEMAPLLIRLGDHERAYSLDAMVAAHLARFELGSIDLDALRYMIRVGRVVLILDGFDELVARTSYDAAADYLDVLVRSVEGRAKLVVSARTQHFRSTGQVLTALGERVLGLRTTRVMELQDFDTDQIRHFLHTDSGGDEAAAEARFHLLSEMEDLLELTRNPRILSLYSTIAPDRIEAVLRGERPFTPTRLYQEIIESWVVAEADRQRELGRPYSLDDLVTACTALARSQWRSGQSLTSAAELSEHVAAALPDRGGTLGQVTHAIGSGSLLVRTDEGHFSFVHQSIAEWLVAKAAADELASSGEAADLAVRPWSALMIEFLCDLGDSQALAGWCTSVVAAPDAGAVLLANAARIASRLRAHADPLRLLLESRELRDADLSERDLRNQDLRQVRLVGVNLSNADLRGADLSGAWLEGVRLTGARLAGSRWSGAAVLDVQGLSRRTDLADAAVTGRDTATPVLAGQFRASSLSFSGGGGLLAYTAGGEVRVWDVDTCALRHTIQQPGVFIARAVFAPGTDYLATAATESSDILLWEDAAVNTQRIATGHTGEIRALAFSPDGVLLASAAEDGTVRLWDRHTGVQVSLLSDHAAAVTAVAFSPDGRLLVTADSKYTRLWDNEGRAVSRPLREMPAVVAVAFTPDGSATVSASRNGMIAVEDIAQPTPQVILHPNLRTVYAVAFAPTGDLMAAASDGVVTIGRINAGRRQTTIDTGEGMVSSVAFAPDGRLLAAACADGTVRLWSVPKFAPVATLLTTPDGWAATYPDGSYKMAGDLGDALRWTMNDRTFAPGVLDAYVPNIRRRPHHQPVP